MIKKLILIICLTFWPNLILANTEYFEQEIDLIESFLEIYIEKNPNVNIVIKPHYRESVYKYEKLKNKNNSIKIMSPNQPFQLIAMLYENLEIVCFHSSAVFSISFLKNIKKIYCLCPQVKTKAMLTISDSLKNFDVYDVVDMQEIPSDHAEPIGSRWLYTLKDYPYDTYQPYNTEAEKNARYKARLIVQ